MGHLSLLGNASSAVVWTDGACKGDRWGGWGVVALVEGHTVVQARGSAEATTNNRMELTAAIEGLRLVPEGSSVVVFSDSQYVVKSAMEWMPGWKRRGFRKSDGDPVSNIDLIRDLDYELMVRSSIFRWVKGHAGNRFNEIADSLASTAAESRRTFRQDWDHPLQDLFE